MSCNECCFTWFSKRAIRSVVSREFYGIFGIFAGKWTRNGHSKCMCIQYSAHASRSKCFGTFLKEFIQWQDCIESKFYLNWIYKCVSLDVAGVKWFLDHHSAIILRLRNSFKLVVKMLFTIGNSPIENILVSSKIQMFNATERMENVWKLSKKISMPIMILWKYWHVSYLALFDHFLLLLFQESIYHRVFHVMFSFASMVSTAFTVIRKWVAKKWQNEWWIRTNWNEIMIFVNVLHSDRINDALTVTRIHTHTKYFKLKMACTNTLE